MMISNDNSNGQTYIQAIDSYRKNINPAVKMFSIDLRGYSKAADVRKEFAEQNFIRIYGTSASILRFIAEKEGSQIEHIRTFHTTVE